MTREQKTETFNQAASRNITIRRDQGMHGLRLENLSLQLENGAYLFSGLSLALEPGNRLVITGPLGCGKSSILRAILDKWEYGSGHIETPPREDILCLTQNAYMPLTTLKGIVTYPKPAKDYTDSAVAAALELAGMGHLVPDMNDTTKDATHWARLSGGQKQSVVFARAFLQKPPVLFLDEATSAMDTAAQEKFYSTVVDLLPESIIISISHRDVMKYHTLHANFRAQKVDVMPVETERYKPGAPGRGGPA